MTLRLNFTAGFDAIIRKKRLASLLEIKAFIETLDSGNLTSSDLDSLESLGNELHSFYSATASLDQSTIEALLKQLGASVGILRQKDRRGSVSSLHRVLAQLQFHMSRIITSELTKMNTGVSVMIKSGS